MTENSDRENARITGEFVQNAESGTLTYAGVVAGIKAAEKLLALEKPDMAAFNASGVDLKDFTLLAAGRGRIDWLDEIYNENGSRNHAGAVIKAAGNGHLDTLRWLRDNGPGVPDYIHLQAMEQAAANGHADAVQWMYHEDMRDNDSGVLVLNKAAVHGHLNIALWLKNQGVPLHGFAPNAGVDISAIAGNGHLKVLQWVIENDRKPLPDELEGALASALTNGKMNVVGWLDKQGVRLKMKESALIAGALVNGHAGAMRWLYSKGARVSNNYEHIKLIDQAIEGHQYETVALLCRNEPWIKLTDGQIKALGDYERGCARWQEALGLNPPRGLHGLRPEGFFFEAFEAAQAALLKEGCDEKTSSRCAYNLSVLFGTEQRIWRYLQKWGRESGAKQWGPPATHGPLHALSENIRMPQEGEIDFQAWGDAFLAEGPEMYKVATFADKIGDLSGSYQDLLDRAYNVRKQCPEREKILYGHPAY